MYSHFHRGQNKITITLHVMIFYNYVMCLCVNIIWNSGVLFRANDYVVESGIRIGKGMVHNDTRMAVNPVRFQIKK